MYKLLRISRLPCRHHCCIDSVSSSLDWSGYSRCYNVSADIISNQPIVRVRQGKLRGEYCRFADSQYVSFKGIPYAYPPVGHLRFKAPATPSLWNGVRDATEHGPVCPQFNERENRIEHGNEDCLYLNVFTKMLTPNQPLPVMVWIHGGGFYTGSGNSDFYGPEFFMSHPMVLVTFNYRLEAFGFLCLNNEEVPGNAGLKDQVAALRWVKENIATFGGDPDNITIFGCSAGAACVSYHMISKMSEGLFSKAICQSGVCLNEWSYNLYPRERAFQLGEILGKKTNDDKELLSFLRSLPSDQLVNKTLPSLKTRQIDISDAITFAPVIEKAGLGEAFLSESPVELVLKGAVANVPLMLGYTSGEGIEIARKMTQILDFMNSSGSVVPRELKYSLTPEEIQKAESQIRMFYFDGKPITVDSLQQLINLETYRLFAYNMIRFAKMHSRNAQNPVYVYKFIAETERNYTKRFYKMEHVNGVCHADDLYYLFNVKNLDVPLTYDSLGLIHEIVNLWYNFAASGDPTTHGFRDTWKLYHENNRNIFVIGNKLCCVQNEDDNHFNFWENLYRDSNSLKTISNKLEADLT